MENKFWKIDEKETTDSWLTVIDNEDPELGVWYKAIVKWDGCIHLNRYFNNPYIKNEKSEENDAPDYIHICELNNYINRLIALRDIANEFYKDKHSDVFGE